MFKIRRNTTQNTIANMKKAQELRIQNIQIVENMNVSSTKKNQIPTITQDLERNDSELKRNLNRSSLSTHK
jgi:SET domain-containing protein|tara:strand:+ start:1794 stop:2006 length:213 start_codon:yes stop_codon:yes gene_type:complete